MDDPLVGLPYPGVRICNVARLSQFHETLELRTGLKIIKSLLTPRQELF